MSWEDIAQMVAQRFMISYAKAFQIVSFVARELRGSSSGVGYQRRWSRNDEEEPF